jgi:enterochelin esterase family protein
MTDNLQAHLVSPQVHDDGRVTFRLRAPQAGRVLVTGILGLPPQPMTKDSQGIWQVTVGPLAPKLYSYLFQVDGADQIDPSNRDVKKWLSLQSMVDVPGQPPRLDQQVDVPHGAIHKHWYRSTTTAGWRPVMIYTPPGYEATVDQPYPLVVLLHGYGDDESAWIEVGRAHWIADNLIAQGKLQPLVIVMPYGHPATLDRTADFEDYIAYNARKMEADVLGDLIPFVASMYRVAAAPDDRAIAGLSMGGGQALTIGLSHPDQFACVGGFSSAAPQGELGECLPLLSERPSVANDLRLLWIACGKDDFLLQRNRAFVEQLKLNQIRHRYEESAGGHDWIVWRQHLAEFLKQCFPAS